MPDPLGQAVRWLDSGGLLAYPTETVWGLGADAGSAIGLERLRRWKGRGADEPLALLVESLEVVGELGFEPGAAAARLAQAFWPGPLTLVVPCRTRFAAGVARDDGAVGLRCSAHPLAEALARRLRREGLGPVTATSLNQSGEPAARTRDEARGLCGESEDTPRLLAVDGAEAGGDEASTVVDTTADVPRVLRWGGLADEQLGSVLRELGAA
jgi:L-threonylcarbamoyladenylate synthase